MKKYHEYNNSLINMKELSSKFNINFHMFDTTNKSEREISFQVLDVILSDMRKRYIDILSKEFNNKIKNFIIRIEFLIYTIQHDKKITLQKIEFNSIVYMIKYIRKEEIC